MSIKLIASDMDGTLLDSKKRLPEELFPWLDSHKDIRFIIASGRQYYTLKKDFLPVHERLIYIAENGALVFDNDEILYLNHMNKSDVLLCLDLIEKIPNVKAILCGVNSAYMETPNEEEFYNAGMYYERLKIVDKLKDAVETDQFLKIAVYFPEFAAEDNAYRFENLPKHLNPVISGLSWIDIANASVNKGVAMEEIQRKLNIDRSECMAFGDYINDRELLLSCDESYCMENGHDEMKKIAKYIAPSNDDNGVMKILHNRFI